MVLTNIHINILNKKKYKYPQNSTKIEDTNLWNFETYKKYLERKNIKYNKIFAQVEDIFIKLIISVKNKLLKEISSSNLESSNFYHLIGFDIILDENLKAYLIEANRRCKFRTDNDVERYYSYNILADTFNILGLKPPKKKDKFKLLKKNIEDSLCELDRPRGGYKLIFPLKSNIKNYRKFFGNSISEEDKELWRKILE